MEELRLYHCTNFESLCKILASKFFMPSYCLEQSNFMEGYGEGAYAMVCFADLLDIEVKRHMENFNSDSYIVMKKEWAIRNFLSPVVYYTPGTIPSAAMQYWSNLCVERGLSTSKEEVDVMAYNGTMIMFAFMKQYEGVYFDKKRNQYSDKKRVFYLEREWRYVPMTKKGEAYYLPKEDYDNEGFVKNVRVN